MTYSHHTLGAEGEERAPSKAGCSVSQLQLLSLPLTTSGFLSSLLLGQYGEHSKQASVPACRKTLAQEGSAWKPSQRQAKLPQPPPHLHLSQGP